MKIKTKSDNKLRWLSKHIDTRMEEIRPLPEKTSFKHFLQAAYNSNFDAFLLGVGLSILINAVLVLIIYKITNEYPITFILQPTAFFSAAVTFGALLISVFSFIIRFSVKIERFIITEKEVLINETKILPILFFYITTISFLPFFHKHAGQFWNFLFVIIAAVYPYIKLIHLTLNPFLLEKRSVTMWQNKLHNLIKKRVDSVVETRIGQNILINFINSMIKKGVQYAPFSTYDEKEYIQIYADKRGYITDYNLNELKNFIHKQQILAGEKKGKELEDSYSEEYIKKVFLFKKLYRQSIEKGEILFVYAKDFFDNNTIKNQLYKMDKFVLIEKSNPEEDVFNELINNITLLKKDLKQSIKEKNFDICVENLKLLNALVNKFMETLGLYKISYSRESTIKENSFFMSEGRWQVIEEIKEIFKESIEEVLEVSSQRILEAHIRHLRLVARDCLSFKNYYVYNIFINLIPYIYKKGVHSTRDDLEQKTLVYVLCKYWEEYATWFIEPKLRNISQKSPFDENELRSLKDFSLGLIGMFNTIMKIAYDKRRLDDFKKFQKILTNLLTKTGNLYALTMLKDSKWRLSSSQLNDKEKLKIKYAITVAETLKEIKHYKESVIWGFGAWFLREYTNNKISIEVFNQWFSNCHITVNDLQYLSDLYIKTIEEDERDTFGWAWWISFTNEEDTMMYMDLHVYLTLFYCIQALKVLKEMSESKKEGLKIKWPDDKIYLIAAEGKVHKCLKDIEEKKEFYLTILNDKELSNVIPSFRKILDGIVTSYREKEEKQIINAKISTSKIESFQNNFLSAYKTSIQMKRIMKKFGFFRTVEDDKKPSTYWGINSWFPKNFFTEKLDVDATYIAKQLGRDLANKANDHILSTIMRGLEQERPVVIKSTNEFLSIVDKRITMLSSAVIFIINSWEAEYTLTDAKNFILSSLEDGEEINLLGKYKDIPVFKFSYDEYGNDDMLLIVDLKKSGELIQYVPPKEVFTEEKPLEHFSFYLKTFDENDAREYIKKNPDFLIGSKNGQNKSKEETIIYLQKQVHLRIVEQFKFELGAKPVGYNIPIVKRI
ncbi:hypothetical protein M0P98_07615 [bacterium]|nr:hypothetical protein [bacterium]